MRKLLYMALTFLLLASCAGQRRHDAALRRAQAILNDAPDSALAILDSMEAFSSDFSRGTQMRWLLLRLSAQNKCDTVFRSDSLQLVLTNYFDRHGTPNERMMAHYLLGRAYSDMGEAPQALESFQKAIECADTTNANCDFNTMYRIYGQMAMLFRQQYMPDEELQSWERYSTYALRAGKMYDHIRGIELTISPYFDLDDTIACLKTTELCHQLYLENGMEEAAASVYPTAIYIHLLNGNYQKAGELMKAFETGSGLFDRYGNISPERESYYYSKGLYYMGGHQTDSAEYFFRRLLGYHFNKNYEAYKGLLSVSNERNNTDSVMKYAILCEQALDSIQAEDQSDALAITNSLYNYNRLDRLASQKAMESQRRMFWMWSIAILSILCLLFYHRENLHLIRRKNEELGRLSTERMEAIRRYTHMERELQMLETDKDAVIKEKKAEIARQSKVIAEYKLRFDSFPDEKIEAAMQNNEIVVRFRKKLYLKSSESLPSMSDWALLKSLIQEYIPAFYDRIVLNKGMTRQEIQTCMLCRLGFHNGEIAVLLDTTTQRITNVKISSNSKLFGEKKASSLKNNLKTL